MPGNYQQPMPFNQNPEIQKMIMEHQNNPFVQNPFIPHKEKIMMIDGILVKQKIDLMEVLTGCEMENKYHIFQKAQGKMKKVNDLKLYEAKEKSGCYSRNCLDNACRAMDLKIKNTNSLGKDITSVKIHKDCTCTCLCCNRPTFYVDYTEEGQDEFLGSIQDDWNCCDYNFTVYGPKKEKLYRIYTECCQCGIQCMGCPCDKCEKVKFTLFDDKGKKIGEIIKKGKNCLKNMMADADNFGIDFPREMNWQHRTLILSALLLIDFMMFEEKG